MPGTLLTLRRVGFSVAPGVDVQRLESQDANRVLVDKTVGVDIELPGSNTSLPTTMLATRDFEFYVELRRRQHAFESTIAGYKAKIPTLNENSKNAWTRRSFSNHDGDTTILSWHFQTKSWRRSSCVASPFTRTVFIRIIIGATHRLRIRFVPQCCCSMSARNGRPSRYPLLHCGIICT
jgi:hypothetical protein